MRCTQYSVQSYAIYLVVYHFELDKGKKFSSTSAGLILDSVSLPMFHAG